MEKWKRIEWNSEELMFGVPVTVVHSRLVDHRDLEVSAYRVHEAYKNLSAVGFCVKIRVEYLGSRIGPSSGYVESVQDGTVVVRAHEDGTVFSGPVDDFHRYYEVD